MEPAFAFTMTCGAAKGLLNLHSQNLLDSSRQGGLGGRLLGFLVIQVPLGQPKIVS